MRRAVSAALPPRLFSPLLLLLLLSQLPRPAPALKIKGMAFSNGHHPDDYRLPRADEALRQLKRAGANYVHISAYARMHSLDALHADRLTDDDTLRYVFRKCRAAGLRVFFKPVIEVSGIWRGVISGSPAWFRKVYMPFIMDMARLAHQEKVALFAVGSEYRDSVNKTNEWTRVISRVRRVYKGKITYVANHDSYKWVRFWNKVDFISISAYFRLVEGGTHGNSPAMAATKQLWNVKADEIARWRRNTELTHKKVVIAEWGVQSKGNGVAYRVPWDWLVSAPVSMWDQVKMYEGFLNAFLPRRWCKGVLLWNWELDPDAGKSWPTIAGYTPQNKPALNVMRRFFRRTYER